MKEKEENKKIKSLNKSFKGMKERAKNAKQPQQLKNFGALFVEQLCTAYDINDLKLNEAAISAYNDVSEILRQRLNDRSERNLQQLWHLNMVLRAVMDKFYLQACKNYD